jgi:Flp pilus assembly protein CpaB
LRRTSRIVLLAGLFLAALTFIVVIACNIGPQPTGPGVTPPPTSAATVIAAKDIPLGTVVTADMVGTQTLQLTARNAAALADVSQAIGQTARTSITAGAQVLSSDFKAGVTNHVEVPVGLRAFPIQVNELTGVGNLVDIGDHLDILISLSGSSFPVVQILPDGTITVVSGLNSLSVKLPLLLEDVQVIGTLAQTAPAPAQGGAPAASTAPTLTGTSKLLILAVTPAQAEVLLFARTTGTLDVILRAPEDAGVTVTTDGVILKTLIDKYGILPPQLVQTILPKR